MRLLGLRNEIVEYRDYMIRDLDDSSAAESYENIGVAVLRGNARIGGPGIVEVDGRAVRSELE